MRSVMLAGIVCVAVTLSTGSPGAQARIERNVVFGMYSGLALLLDVHYPETPNGHAIVSIAGSGWNAPLGLNAVALKERRGRLWHSALTAAGYTVFVINHRASPRFRYPAAVEDAQRAVRFIRANAARFNIDANRIGAFGGSSGGHLASMLGVLDGAGVPDDPDAVNRLSARVQAVVALFPPCDLRRIRTVAGLSAVTVFVGVRPTPETTGPGTEEARRYRAASPVTHVSPDDAPMLLFHGDADETVPHEQSVLMEAALKGSGVKVRFVSVTGGRHAMDFGLPAGHPSLREYSAAMLEWFAEHLRTPSSSPSMRRPQ